jgi:magnesium transporter
LHDIIRNLVRRDSTVLDDALNPYFQDVLDHVKRETEELDALRDTLVATLDAYLSISANKLNHTLRIMAAWSIILMAMAWLAGIYGMNFGNMPELKWRFGYIFALALMLVTGGGLIVFFRKRGWL